MTFWKLNEDPFYDEDGVLIDEDDDLEIIEQEVTKQAPEACYTQDCDPYSTINS
jgi:hypothetical protein